MLQLPPSPVAEFVDAMTKAYSLEPWQRDYLTEMLTKRRSVAEMTFRVSTSATATILGYRLSKELLAHYIALSDGAYSIGEKPKKRG